MPPGLRREPPVEALLEKPARGVALAPGELGIAGEGLDALREHVPLAGGNPVTARAFVDERCEFTVACADEQNRAPGGGNRIELARHHQALEAR